MALQTSSRLSDGGLGFCRAAINYAETSICSARTVSRIRETEKPCEDFALLQFAQPCLSVIRHVRLAVEMVDSSPSRARRHQVVLPVDAQQRLPPCLRPFKSLGHGATTPGGR